MHTDHPQSILIVNIKLIGDVVLSTPLLDLFVTAYPEAKIDYLVNRGTGEFLEKDPRVRRVYYSEKWQKGAHSGSNNYLRTLFRKYDIAVCLNKSDRASLAVVAAGRQTRIGFCDPDKSLGVWWRKLLMSSVMPYNEELHVVLHCQVIAETLGLPVDNLRVKLYWDTFDNDTVNAALSPPGVRDKYFVIHPFARWRYKYWDIERFIALSDLVAGKYKLTPVWTSSPDPEEIGLLVAAAARCTLPPVVIPGTLSLNQMTCLIEQAGLYIGLDTAISHIAASTGVPMVALYGPTDMFRWHPWDNESSVTVRAAVDTSRSTFRSGTIVAMQAACEHTRCIRPHCYRDGLENPCMMAISARDVLQEIDTLLSENGTDSIHE
jgi:heptosyltransferase-3